MPHHLFHHISVSVSPTNSLIVHVTIETRKPVVAYITYGNHRAGKFVSACTPTFDVKHVLPIARLRAENEYLFRVHAMDICGDSYVSERRSFTTGPLPANLVSSLQWTLQGRFSKQVVVILCINGVDIAEGFFQGYVGVDTDGQVVWYYQSPPGITPAAGDFFQMKDGRFLITRGYSLGLPNAEANIDQAAQMQIIDPTGEVLYLQPLVCENNAAEIGTKGAVIANLGWTHASFQDPADGLIRNLGLQLRDPFYDAGLAPAGERMQLGSTYRSWNPATGDQNIETTDFTLLNPITFRGTLSNESSGSPLDCDGSSPGLSNQDWTHGNAFSRLHATSNYFVSQRDTSTVLILEPRTFKLLTKFGTTNPSDLTFLSPTDRFYNQHDAHELENGNLIMFDDGTTRPPSEGGSYARGAEYILDFVAKTIRKVWEFRPSENITCEDVGSCRRLKNGNTIVDFGASNLTTKHVFEAGVQSNVVVADLSLSARDTSNSWLLYRAVPIDSILGERRL